jgi:hypothetical protein
MERATCEYDEAFESCLVRFTERRRTYPFRTLSSQSRDILARMRPAYRHLLLLLSSSATIACGNDASEQPRSNAGHPDAAEADAAFPGPRSDASVTDASSALPGDARAPSIGSDAAACVAPGDFCQAAPCCAGSTCAITPDTREAICAAQCSSPSECVSACCAALQNSPFGVCAPSAYCDLPDAGLPPIASAQDSGITDAGAKNLDAATNDGSTPNLCVDLGDACSTSTCCEGLVCTADPLTSPANTCATVCSTNDQCASGCCVPDPNASGVCLSPVYCNGGGGGGVQDGTITKPAGCGELIVVANDGTYLGLATSNTAKSESVCNSAGRYGSSASSTSIYNSAGRYGSTAGSLSAYNSATSRPPALRCSTSDAQIAWITKNTVKLSRIDPDQLCANLGANGL